jgi:GNAT superfamily N-acetyltransferase
MAENMHSEASIEVFPATAERWQDLEVLLGSQSAFAGCWCMYWRLVQAEFNRLKGDGARAALRDLTLSNRTPGVIAYVGRQPAGWCSIGPRQDFSGLEKSHLFKWVDDTPVWSIVCFYVAKAFRKQGVMAALLRGAVAFAAQNGARVIEGYPLDLQSRSLAGKQLRGVSGCIGIVSTFSAAGFVKVADVSEKQWIMRYTVREDLAQDVR